MTVLTGGSQYIYHGDELPDSKPVETHKETRWAVKSLRNAITLGSSPSCSGGIWKRSIFSTVRPTVHTYPSRKRRNLKYRHCILEWTENVLKTELSRFKFFSVVQLVDGKHLMHFSEWNGLRFQIPSMKCGRGKTSFSRSLVYPFLEGRVKLTQKGSLVAIP